jgi:hypothetical protein
MQGQTLTQCSLYSASASASQFPRQLRLYNFDIGLQVSQSRGCLGILSILVVVVDHFL